MPVVPRPLGIIEDRRLAVTRMDERQKVFRNGGSCSRKPQVELTVLKEMFWVRLVRFADMVFLVLCILVG